MRLDYRNGPPDAALKDIEEMAAANASYYSDVRVRTVKAMASGPWLHQLTMIQPFPQETAPGRVPSRRYSNVLLLEQWIEPSQLVPFYMGEIAKKRATVDGESLDPAGDGSVMDGEVLPGKNIYSQYPGRLYRTIGRSENTIDSRHLLRPGLPYYPDLCEAIRDWTGVPIHRGMNDGRMGSVMVFMPECRARIVSFTPEDDVVGVTLALAETVVKDLRVVGGWQEGDQWQPFEKLVLTTGPELQLEVPRSAQALNVHLIGGDERWYDYHLENEHGWVGQERVLGASQGKTADGQWMQDALLKGEDETIEFKPLFKEGDAREPEIVETIIAFLNKRGGTLLIGVTDYGQVAGIGRDLVDRFPGHGRDLEKPIELYKGYLRKMCSDKMNRCPMLPMKDVHYRGHRVLLVQVPEGNEKIYQRVEDKAIFVRRGATNARADADTEIPEMLQHRARGGSPDLGGRQW